MDSRKITRRSFLAGVAGVAASCTTLSRDRTRPPNIVWIITDEQRTDTLRSYGSPWARMPVVDGLAREGTVFLNAITPGPVCAPARASLVSGLYPHQHGIWHNIPPAEYPQLPMLTDAFHAAGYRSASFGKRHYSASNMAFQTEVNFEVSDLVDWFDYKQGLDRTQFDAVRYPLETHAWLLGGRFPGDAEQTSEARVVREAAQWLEEGVLDQPFFLRLSFNAPHTPVTPPPPFDAMFADIPYPEEVEGAPADEPQWIRETLRSYEDAGRLTRAQVLAARRYYYGFAAFLDSQIGAFMEWMEARHLLENTIVVFVSDHGTHIGDYGLVQKQSFYEPVVKVPYFFWGPGFVRRGVVEAPVETRSLMPTLLELAGLEVPDEYQEISLAGAVRRGEEVLDRPGFSEFTLGTLKVRKHDRLVMVQEGKWRCSACLESPEDGALYNLAADPYERTNLFHVPEAGEKRAHLMHLIDVHMQT